MKMIYFFFGLLLCLNTANASNCSARCNAYEGSTAITYGKVTSANFEGLVGQCEVLITNTLGVDFDQIKRLQSDRASLEDIIELQKSGFTVIALNKTVSNILEKTEACL
jgi:hypothetical protein